MTALKALCKLICLLGLCAALIPLQLIILLYAFSFRHPRAVSVLPMVWHKCACRIFQITVRVHGDITPARPTLFVSNHISYLDIPVIGAHVKGAFVAKSEVAGWPLFGLLSKLSQTVFVKRAAKDAVKDNDALYQRLSAKRNVILFPEGTSSPGKTVLPFKSTLFYPLNLFENEDTNLSLQAFTIVIDSIDGCHVDTDKKRDLYAWHGDMTLAPHLWSFAKTKGAVISLHFHPPLSLPGSADRKAIAKECEKMVASPLQTDVTLAA